MAQVKKSKYISFRVTEAQLKEIDIAATGAGLKAREWCRDVVFEKLGHAPAITRSERLLFEHLLRAQYLLTQGFQLLADEKLTGEEWKRLRATAKQRASELADAALTNDAERTNQRSRIS